jgi:Coenzyme PQQ synthesis protein D (PqqD)
MTELRAHPAVIYTPLDATEAILLHLETKRYYTLNETGRRIWELASSGQPAEEIGTALAAEYEVTPESAGEKARLLMADLTRERLLVE